MPPYCVNDGCKKQAYFNLENETKGLYCSTHKLDGMIDVRNKKCRDCKKQAYFNFEGETTGLYCSTHKKDDMIDVKNKKCLLCKKQPIYNVEGETKPIYCSTHKLDGMVDVKHKRCLLCKKQPIYNVEGETKPIYCSTHKLDGMIDVKSKRCLLCKKIPHFNFENETKGLYCNTHKLDGMIDVKHKKCKNGWCRTQPTNNKYDGYCLHCYMNMFPDKPVARNYKTKEQSVVDYIKDKFPNVDWIADKRVDNGCSKRRPDLLLHLGNQIIIIEVDENQHTDYNCSCENKRIMELSLDVSHIPIVFIRFNPDMYFKQKTKVSSCWCLNGNGILTIKKKDEWNERLSCLSNVVQYWLKNITDKTIETIHLYYDE